MEAILLIDHIDLARLDLNLLVAFDALAQEGSVTRAAARLGIGQPAMSHALARLRDHLGDELFTRVPGGMKPTPRTLALIEPVRSALALVQQSLLSPESFDPATAERTFVVGMPDSVEVALLPRLLAHMRDHAPGVTIRARATDRFQVLDQLDDGRLQLAVGAFEAGGMHHKRRGLYAAGYACLFHPDRVPLEPPLTLDQYLSYPHVLLGSLTARPHGLVDEALARLERTRTVAVTTAHFIAVPFLLREAAVLSTCIQPAARLFCDAFGLRSSPVPVALPDSRISMLWHASYDREPGHRWLRQAVVGLARIEP